MGQTNNPGVRGDSGSGRPLACGPVFLLAPAPLSPAGGRGGGASAATQELLDAIFWVRG